MKDLLTERWAFSAIIDNLYTPIHHLPHKLGKEKSIDRMASSDPTPPTKGTCNKAMSHGQCAAAQDIEPQDQVQHLIAFASTILNISVKSEKKSPVVRSVKILSRDPMLLRMYTTSKKNSIIWAREIKPRMWSPSLSFYIVC